MSATAPPDEPDAVLVAVMHRDNEFAPSTTQSLLALVMHDAMTHGRVIRGGGPMLVPATPMTMPDVRNQIARTLVDGLPDVPWLLMIDADMGFQPTIVDDLIDAADADERPVVGALCFAMRRGEPDGFGGWRTYPEPTIYQFARSERTGLAGFKSQLDYPPNALVRCGATGTAALLVHRSVFEKLRNGESGGWFDRLRIEPGAPLLGEDMSFCARLGAAEVPVHVHTGVQTSHMRTVWLSEDDYRRLA